MWGASRHSLSHRLVSPVMTEHLLCACPGHVPPVPWGRSSRPQGAQRWGMTRVGGTARVGRGQKSARGGSCGADSFPQREAWFGGSGALCPVWSGGQGTREGRAGVKAQGQRAPGRVPGPGSGGPWRGEEGGRGDVTAETGVLWATAGTWALAVQPRGLTPGCPRSEEPRAGQAGGAGQGRRPLRSPRRDRAMCAGWWH